MFARSTLRYSIQALLLLALSACASTGQDRCEDPDWYVIGFDDGSSGFGADRFDEHVANCAGVGIEADKEAWRAGREDGLTHFCSAAGGIAEGSRGRIRSNVCPPELAPAFREGYRLGREIFDTNQEMDRIEREIRALEARASGGVLNTAIKDNSEARMRALEHEYDRLGRELRLLELRADRLAQQ